LLICKPILKHAKRLQKSIDIIISQKSIPCPRWHLCRLFLKKNLITFIASTIFLHGAGTVLAKDLDRFTKEPGRREVYIKDLAEFIGNADTDMDQRVNWQECQEYVLNYLELSEQVFSIKYIVKFPKAVRFMVQDFSERCFRGDVDRDGYIDERDDLDGDNCLSNLDRYHFRKLKK